MGLDITAYSKLTAAPEVSENEAEENYKEFARIHPLVLDWTRKEFPGRAHDVEAGIYRFAETFDFRAGSYSGYNAWRDMLARYAGYGSARALWNSRATEGPFFELIHFADNEGYIGPACSAKLARDFAEHEARIRERAMADDDGDYFMSKYHDWLRAFEMAADGGCVDFH